MRTLRILTAFLLASTASAHSGSVTSGFGAGILHPLAGPDHLLAMVSIGILAAPFGKRGLWIPAAFMTAMMLGGLSGVAGLHLPFMEQGVALTVLTLGLLLAFTSRLPPGTLALLAGVMGLLHGHAHGTELPENVGALEFFTGFTVATGLLHVVGYGLGVRAGLRRGVGLGVAAAGAWLLLGA
ncbi:HupE/UreJ family protein [Deinococcus knuensis]|uniref:Urease accessory protein UreJ n=1 Tax=Deinococcus knuensis TaxID=1837380 RepID=A0ABQ2SGF3_9DEIO|nr:HupE/UreJ family protein [Deinococcus knuensis]GGS22495.1 urease accessory protein UreJ [Deinococcus knuensis]